MAKSQEPTELVRMQSGIHGLDSVLGGGLPRNGIYLIIGPPGSGKTILTNQICFAHVAAGGRAVYLTLLAETTSAMLTNLQTLSFFDPEVVASTLYYFSGYNELETGGLDSFLKSIQHIIRAQTPTLLVIDGLAMLEALDKSTLAYNHFIRHLQILASLQNCTILLCMHLIQPNETRPEDTLVDGIIELNTRLVGLRAVREIQVHKLRGTDHLLGKHAFAITQAGIVVYPRLEARFVGVGAGVQPNSTRVPFGIEALDTMLGGGLPARTMTMLLGPTGSGKTLVGLHLLTAGANAGERGLFVGFYEPPRELCATADALNMNLSSHVEQGAITLLWYPPYDSDIDAIAEYVLKFIQEHNVQRLFIDGVEGLEDATSNPTRLPRFLMALSNVLRVLQVTSAMSVEVRDLASPTLHIPIEGISTICDNIILLRQSEVQARMTHVVSIIKMRRGKYDRAIRHFSFTESGMTMGDVVDNVDATLTGSAYTHSAANAHRQK